MVKLCDYSVVVYKIDFNLYEMCLLFQSTTVVVECEFRLATLIKCKFECEQLEIPR